jgi:hypothetical protein
VIAVGQRAIGQDETLAKHLLFVSDALVFDDIPENSLVIVKQDFQITILRARSRVDSSAAS